MAEKLYVILEVKPVDPEERCLAGYNRHYKPVDARNDGQCDEEMWLQPERVIPASRLDYLTPDKGTIYFNKFVDGGWCEHKAARAADTAKVLALKPPEIPVSEWDAWVEEMPTGPASSDSFKAWFRRMPVRK